MSSASDVLESVFESMRARISELDHERGKMAVNVERVRSILMINTKEIADGTGYVISKEDFKKLGSILSDIQRL